MNTDTASLAQSEELYRLSRWSTGSWITDGGNVVPNGFLKPEYETHPAYNLGFLMRKLHPAGALMRWGIDLECRPDAGKDKWFVNALDGNHDFRFWANSPEDAMAGLAIKLLKKGVL